MQGDLRLPISGLSSGDVLGPEREKQRREIDLEWPGWSLGLFFRFTTWDRWSCQVWFLFPCFWHFRVLTVFVRYPNKKKKKKKKKRRRGFWIARYILDTFCLYTCQTSMLAILLCPCVLDENCGFQLLGDEPSKSSIKSN